MVLHDRRTRLPFSTDVCSGSAMSRAPKRRNNMIVEIEDFRLPLSPQYGHAWADQKAPKCHCIPPPLFTAIKIVQMQILDCSFMRPLTRSPQGQAQVSLLNQSTNVAVADERIAIQIPKHPLSYNKREKIRNSQAAQQLQIGEFSWNELQPSPRQIPTKSE